jgi:transposase
LRDWLPADHLAWFLLDAVEQMDLTGFYAAYRADGHGRAAHDPAMMVALVLYGYAAGERSARAIERRCVEDIPFRVIAASTAPDHATIARFRVRHEQALAGLFGEVLRLCAKAGAVSVGVIAVDGTRVKASAADRANMDYEQLAKEILAEADRVDRQEAERFGDSRGDELPSELADPVTRRQRLREAKRRLDEEWQAKHAEMEAWKVARADYTARTGRKLGGPLKPRPVPPAPGGRINITDPDSRPVKTARGFLQGYTAQAVATEEQIVIAADVITGGNERHRLEPLVTAARDELHAAGIDREPEWCSPTPAFGTARTSRLSPGRASARWSNPTPTPARPRPDCAAARPTNRCARSSRATTKPSSTDDAKRSSSPSSPTPKSTAAPTASNAAA